MTFEEAKKIKSTIGEEIYIEELKKHGQVFIAPSNWDDFHSFFRVYCRTSKQIQDEEAKKYTKNQDFALFAFASNLNFCFYKKLEV